MKMKPKTNLKIALHKTQKRNEAASWKLISWFVSHAPPPKSLDALFFLLVEADFGATYPIEGMDLTRLGAMSLAVWFCAKSC